MDSTDEDILEILRENGRAPYTDIAEELGVSEGTVRNRVESMLDSGVIERFTVDVSKEREIEAFIMVRVGTDADIGTVVDALPGDIEVYELAGDQDLIVHAARSSSEEVNDAVDAIREVSGVESTRTYMVLGKPG